MRIDEARRHDQPVGVDGALGAFAHLADLGHLAVGDCNIGVVTLGAGAIDHAAVLDDEIVAHRCFLRELPFPKGTPPASPWRMRKARDCQSWSRSRPTPARSLSLAGRADRQSPP